MKITMRRTVNVGNFESISVEVVAEHEDVNRARLIGNKLMLELLQQDMIRIFNIRVQNVNNNPYDQINLELQGVIAELAN